MISVRDLIESFAARILTLCVVAGLSTAAPAGDWPMWRYDAGRTASSLDALPRELYPHWTRRYSPREQVWDDPLNHDLMSYDRIFEPVAKDGRMFLSFNDSDKVVAIDIRDGSHLWTFYADGPVRLPPAVWGDRVYFASDDGHLYCVSANFGSLKWKFRGGPSNQKAIGNGRVISAWPARGAPVVNDGTVYFAASIWPFMGTFIYALDAESGEVRWTNDSTSASYIKQPHSAPSFAGVAPQGCLVVAGDDLIVPGGRSVPAVLNRKTGALRYYELNEGGKGTGGSLVLARGDEFYVHTRLRGVRAFDLQSGTKTAFMTNEPVLSEQLIYAAEVTEPKEGEGQPVIKAYDLDKEVVWTIEGVDGTGDLIQAGKTLYAAGGGRITALALGEKSAEVVWKMRVDGEVVRLIAASDHLIAVTLDGRIHAFGAQPKLRPELLLPATRELNVAERYLDFANALAAEATIAGGYVVWFGLTDESRVKTFASVSDAQLLIVSEDEGRLRRLRDEFDAAGLLGKRVALHHASIQSFQGPPNVAKTVVIDSSSAVLTQRQLQRAYAIVRPYGGKLICLRNLEHATFVDSLKDADLEKASVTTSGYWDQAERVGALVGAADWTHQYGDIANSVKSDDRRVKLPLGILWFGGSSNTDVLPRHGHGPPEQVIGGRLYIQGMNSLSCRDVYTGQVLWRREFEDLGTFDIYFDATYKDTPLDPAYNQVHIPGANGRGTNYVATDDAVYVVEGSRCHVLSLQTGETTRTIELPSEAEWGFIGVYGDILLGGEGFANYRDRLQLAVQESDEELKDNLKGFGSTSIDRSASRALLAFDRHTGKQLWRLEALHSFIHNGIVAGDDRVYCLDKLPRPVEDKLKRRGQDPPDNYRIVAVDVQSGLPLWEQTGDIFGTWLGYSKQHHVLLLAGAAASDRLKSEVGDGMAVYDGLTGDVRWRDLTRAYSGPCILHNDTILTNANSYQLSSGAFNLLDGTPRTIMNPLTREEQPWQVCRAYGCNNIIASENFLTFRSGAAGYYDLNTMSGTGNLGGFKSGCTSNLVVANGILNAPDYTRTCSCAYQNQTSLGLVHMPEMDMWTVNHTAQLSEPGQDIKRIGVNFGAPGDRVDEQGTLWIDFPLVGGESPDVQITTSGAPTYYHHHTLKFSGPGHPWVGASGIRDFGAITIPLSIHKESYADGRRFSVASADDDGEEQKNGDVNLDSSDLELTKDADDQIVGIRFSDVAVPNGAVVTEAYIQFTCDEVSEEKTSLSIAIADQGDASEFKQPRSISSLTTLPMTVAWEPVPWKQVDQAGLDERTPDLTQLVQAVVSRDDWKSGNAMAFVIRGEGKRVAAAHQSDQKTAAQLVIRTDQDQKEAAAVKRPTPHTVRLYFAEPDNLAIGERVFDIVLQGQLVEEKFDIVREAGTPRRTIVREFCSIMLGGELNVLLPTYRGAPILSGIEIIQEELRPVTD